MSESVEPVVSPPTDAPEIAETDAPNSQEMETRIPTEQIDHTTAEITGDSAVNPPAPEAPEVIAPVEPIAPTMTTPENLELSTIRPDNPVDETPSAVIPVDETEVPEGSQLEMLQKYVANIGATSLADLMSTLDSLSPENFNKLEAARSALQLPKYETPNEQVDPTEPVSPEAPPPDLSTNKDEVTVIYIDGGTGSTRLLLAQRRPGGDVSLNSVGDKLSALRLLRGSEQNGEGEAEFLSSLRTTLSSASAFGGGVQVILGLTAWYRKSNDEERAAFASLWDAIETCAVESLPGCRFHLLAVTEVEEGEFEYEAATYAAKRVLGIELDCVLSLGSGSIQCTCGPRRGGGSCSFILQLQDGEEAIATDANTTGSWEQTCVAACVEGLAPCIAGWAPSLGNDGAIDDESDSYLLASGASWYAALGAGLAGIDGSNPTTHGLEIVLQKLKDTAANSDGELKVRANVVRLYTSLESLLRTASGDVRSRCQIVFAREWKINEDPFRVTWSAGHFLKLLERHRKDEQEPGSTTDAPNDRGTVDPMPTSVLHMEDDPELNPLTEAETAAVEPISKTPVAAKDTIELVSPQQDEQTEVVGDDLDNPFTLPAKANQETVSQKVPPSQEGPQSLPQASQTPKKKQVSTNKGQSPGLVVYIVAPAAAATGEAALSAEEYAALSAAAVRSGAAVVISASAPGAVAALDFELNRRNILLREIDAFANSRFKPPGSHWDDESPLHDLFKALAIDSTGVLDAESIALGLRSLGFQGDVVGAAAALTPEGSNRVARADFVRALKDAAEQPELVAVCPGSLADEENIEGTGAASWPVVRKIKVETGLTSREFIETKAREAHTLAGGAQSESGHGVVLVLASRGRSLLQPLDYEQYIRQELLVATEILPPRWPLLWSPGPAEVGLLSEAAMHRPVWAIPKQSAPEALVSWLRYLLVVRPNAPTTNTSGAH